MSRYSRVSILLSILVLIKIVLFAVDFEMILEFASLLLDMLGNEVIDIVEELVNLRLAQLDGILQRLADGCTSLLPESGCVLWLGETTASQILFKTFDW
jgi:small neutral amino acid transporter SnatA (MarC family)